MKDYLIEVWFERDKIYEDEADTKEEILEKLNCFDFSNRFLYFTVKDKDLRAVPHYNYNEIADMVEY